MADEKSNTAVLERTTSRPWDYSVVTIHARQNTVLEGALTERGMNGWELTFVTMPVPNEYQCIFRRQA